MGRSGAGRQGRRGAQHGHHEAEAGPGQLEAGQGSGCWPGPKDSPSARQMNLLRDSWALELVTRTPRGLELPLSTPSISVWGRSAARTGRMPWERGVEGEPLGLAPAPTASPGTSPHGSWRGTCTAPHCWPEAPCLPRWPPPAPPYPGRWQRRSVRRGRVSAAAPGRPAPS